MFPISFAQRSKSIYNQVLQYGLTSYVTASSSPWRNINVRMNSNLNSSVHTDKPLALILPWLGATKKGVSKYASLYENNGIDVMVHHAKISDFLWPRKGLNSSLLLLENLKYEVKKADEEKGRPIIIHSFSLGCYFYALMMMQMLKHSESYDILWKGIVGQVIDSPVVGSLNEMAYGVSKMTFPNSALLSSTVKNICMLFFALTQKHTVKYYDESIRVFHKAAPASTYLILSCRNDPMLIPKVTSVDAGLPKSI